MRVEDSSLDSQSSVCLRECFQAGPELMVISLHQHPNSWKYRLEHHAWLKGDLFPEKVYTHFGEGK